jgi:hypothetical protein
MSTTAYISLPVASFDLYVGQWQAGNFVQADDHAMRATDDVAAAMHVKSDAIAERQQPAHHAHTDFKIDAGTNNEVAVAQPLAEHQVMLAIFQIFSHPANECL